MIQQDLIWQQLGFMLQAAQLGIICGILYDVLRLLRYRHGRLCTFFLDVLFSCIASGMIFVLVIGMTQSRLRIFLLAAFGIGWLLWYITLGRFLRGIAKKLRQYAVKQHLKRRNGKKSQTAHTAKKTP